MTPQEPSLHRPSAPVNFDTSSHEEFYEYYKKQSLSPQTMQRFGGIAEAVMRMRGGDGGSLDVLDVGCGAGAQCGFWSDKGHRYMGLDINEPLIRLARERAVELGRDAKFEVGSATVLPFPDASFDVCLLPELLEHIADWKACLDEAIRVLRPNGFIYISTSNKLCPKQQEFNLVGYSWYPGFVKRYVERRAVTDWPAVANYAKYPAVNWFTYYQLRGYLSLSGFRTFDRFDVMRTDNKSQFARALVATLRALAPLRFVGHVLTSDLVVVAQRN